MSELQNLSVVEISELVTSFEDIKPQYVQLTGYYPGIPYDKPVIYYLSETAASEDHFSIIKLTNNGQYKLEAAFGDIVDLAYCGIKGDGIADETVEINKSLVRLRSLNVKNVIISGLYKIDVDTGKKIQLQSDTNYYLNGRVEALPGKNNGYELISFYRTVNTMLKGGEIKGNKYSFKAENGKYYKIWKPNESYQVDDYVYVNNIPLKVDTAGVSGSVKPGFYPNVKCTATIPEKVPFYCNKDYNVNTLVYVTDGSITYTFVNGLDLGEWGFGINVLEARNFIIENVEISECWGDGIYIKDSYNGNITSVICRDNRRQGLSIIDGDGINVVNSQFIKTSGTIPETGIDIEPNEKQKVRNVNIVNCICDQNNGYGLLITTPDATAGVSDVNILNLATRNNGLDGFACKTEGDEYSHTIFNINVQNLASSGNKASQIFIEGANGVKVRNGRIENAFDSPLVDLYKVHNVKISDLEMVGNGDGIKIRKGADNVTIEGNYIETVKTCITDDHTNFKKENIIIKANNLKSVQQSAIDILEYTSLTVTDNAILRTGADGIKIGNTKRAIISGNKTNNVGMANNKEYGHIVIQGEASEIICENNILANYADLTFLPVGIIAGSPQMNYCTFRTLHSHNNSNFGPDKILSNSTIKVQDIR
ncbi:right-handed parallel beta-helix repeat-containing protein [Chryseobacterium sp.]|uniref:right-handed parallel beta-helix repeat-containing protein n=1 Tax=Chryseobacterium sp. TaxID=1871047 RepID=UPI003218FE14